jgi:hypothetical protein
VRDGASAWSQQAYVKASNTGEDDLFGHSVALSGDGNTLAWGVTACWPPATVNRDVDVLFVIDNSGSMAQEQNALALAFGSFVEVLERPEIVANYRIGFTTTDDGNPWCEDTTPEAGTLPRVGWRRAPSLRASAGLVARDRRHEARCQHSNPRGRGSRGSTQHVVYAVEIQIHPDA